MEKFALVSAEDLEARQSASVTNPQFDVLASRGLTSWLHEQRLSFAFTTYQARKLFLIGLQADGGLSIFERTFSRCLGLWGDGQTLWMTSLYQLWRFENALEPGQAANGFDRIYVPQVGYVTGDLDIHDVAIDAGVRQHAVGVLGDGQRAAQLFSLMAAAVSDQVGCEGWLLSQRSRDGEWTSLTRHPTPNGGEFQDHRDQTLGAHWGRNSQTQGI